MQCKDVAGQGATPCPASKDAAAEHSLDLATAEDPIGELIASPERSSR